MKIKTLRIFRVIAKESDRPIIIPKKQFDEWESERDVKFESAEVVFENTEGNLDTHYITDESDTGELKVNWSYSDDTIVMVVFRYSDGDTFGKSTGNWRVHKVFYEHSEAKKYVERHNMRDIFDKKKGYFEDYEDTEIVLLPFENRTK